MRASYCASELAHFQAANVLVRPLVSFNCFLPIVFIMCFTSVKLKAHNPSGTRLPTPPLLELEQIRNKAQQIIDCSLKGRAQFQVRWKGIGNEQKHGNLREAFNWLCRISLTSTGSSSGRANAAEGRQPAETGLQTNQKRIQPITKGHRVPQQLPRATASLSGSTAC